MLKENSQQEKDIAKFRWFSNDYLGFIERENYIIDIRYSAIPNQISPLWGIVVDEKKAMNEHVIWKTNRKSKKRDLNKIISLIKGKNCSIY